MATKLLLTLKPESWRNSMERVGICVSGHWEHENRWNRSKWNRAAGRMLSKLNLKLYSTCDQLYFKPDWKISFGGKTSKTWLQYATMACQLLLPFHLFRFFIFSCSKFIATTGKLCVCINSDLGEFLSKLVSPSSPNKTKKTSDPMANVTEARSHSWTAKWWDDRDLECFVW